MTKRTEDQSKPHIQRGTLLRYRGYEKTPSIKINNVLLPGHPEYDGGLPGVSIAWLKKRGQKRWFFPCASLEQFFADYRFSNLEVVNAAP